MVVITVIAIIAIIAAIVVELDHRPSRWEGFQCSSIIQ